MLTNQNEVEKYYAKQIEAKRLKVEKAIKDADANLTKQTIIRCFLEALNFARFCEKLGISATSIGSMKRPVLEKIRNEISCLEELITLTRRRPDILGEWTHEKFQDTVREIADNLSEVLGAKS